MTARVEALVSLSLDIQTLVHQHRVEIIFNGRRLTYMENGLLPMLKAKVAESGASEEDQGNASGRPVTPRMPAAQEAAFSLLVEVDMRAAQIARWLGASGTSRKTADNLDWINNEIDNFDDRAVLQVADSIHDLRHRVELELHKVEPPRPIRGTCPTCQETDTLRVHFNQYEIEKAVCSRCDATWSSDQLGELNTLINTNTRRDT